MLDDELNVKLVDFGLSTQCGSGQVLTQFGREENAEFCTSACYEVLIERVDVFSISSVSHRSGKFLVDIASRVRY